MEFVAKLLPGLHSIQLMLVCQLFWDPPLEQFLYPRVSVMVSCSRDPEICGNITESSSTVNLLSRSTFLIFSTISSVNWRSSAPLIILHRRTTVLNSRHHLNTLIQFIAITKCNFYLIINLNRSFSLPNEVDYAAYFCIWWDIGLTFFMKPIVVLTVLNVLTSNRSHCRGEESGYTAV